MSRARVGRQQLDRDAGRRLITGRDRARGGTAQPTASRDREAVPTASSRSGRRRRWSPLRAPTGAEGARLRSLRPRTALRRFGLILGAGAVVIILVVTLHGAFAGH